MDLFYINKEKGEHEHHLHSPGVPENNIKEPRTKVED